MTRSAFCCRCRAQLVITGDMPPAPWIVRDDYAAFCSESCAEQGVPKAVRPHLPVQIMIPEGAPVYEIVGAYDALHGYDVLCWSNPDYVRGHGNGMETRPIIEASMAMLAGMQGIFELSPVPPPEGEPTND